MKSITATVGIDVSKERLDVYIEGPSGASRMQVTNNARGIKSLLEAIPPGSVVALEATGRYEAKVRHAMDASGMDVRVQNPRLVRRLAEGLGVQAKTDLIDAQLLARTADLCAPNAPRSKEREQLADLGRTIETLKRERTGHMKRMKSPGFSQVAAKALGCIIRAIEREIAKLEAAFVKEVASTQLGSAYELARSVPGVGAVLARVAICELPEDLSGWSVRQIAAYAGLAPMDNASGKKQGPAKLPKHGNMHLKAALYMPAMAAMTHNTWATELYLKLRAKGKAHQQAIVAVMRKLLLHIVAVLKRGTAWQPAPARIH